jgi:hypothetical protein
MVEEGRGGEEPRSERCGLRPHGQFEQMSKVEINSRVEHRRVS